MLYFFSLISLIRHIKLRLKGQKIIISGSCHQCGNCCKRLNLELKGKWISSRRQFEELTNEYPELTRFEILGKDSAGLLEFNCTWLRKDNTCRDYHNRLYICKQYPCKRLFLAGGKLTVNCG
ncbi:MAG: YkgJ family cysteine cluster protein [Candidatus Kuenenia sp.]|nr:YkgJ family cysteine cluster protein [Candidatus Kuenenia hertensis]